MSTCRDYSFGIGPLPYDKILKYAIDMGLDEDMQEIFEVVMSAMDTQFLKWKAQEIESQK